MEKRDLLRHERDLFSKGVLAVGGVDEAGRGCLAGPVFAGAVLLPPLLFLPGVDDSKKLRPSERERLFDLIIREAVSWGVASVDAGEIDRINIHQASLKAMREAVRKLKPQPEFLLVDGRFSVPGLKFQRPIIRGDQSSQSIAAASILAKVSRDRWMIEAGKAYPQFHFSKHKGYGTPEHLDEIRRHGVTSLHRRSFKQGIFLENWQPSANTAI